MKKVIPSGSFSYNELEEIFIYKEKIRYLLIMYQIYSFIELEYQCLLNMY